MSLHQQVSEKIFDFVGYKCERVDINGNGGTPVKLVDQADSKVAEVFYIANTPLRLTFAKDQTDATTNMADDAKHMVIPSGYADSLKNNLQDESDSAASAWVVADGVSAVTEAIDRRLYKEPQFKT